MSRKLHEAARMYEAAVLSFINLKNADAPSSMLLKAQNVVNATAEAYLSLLSF